MDVLNSSKMAAAELRDNAAKMLAEANREMRKLFRSSRKIQLTSRSGVILLVDDMPQQKTVLENMVTRYALHMEVKNVATAREARAYIDSEHNNIRLVVIDIMLVGSAAHPDGSLTEDGLSLVDWLKLRCPDLPFIITTGHAERAEEATIRFPGVDVLLKGQTDIEEYADAIGLADLPNCCSGIVIPPDDSENS